MNTHTTRAKNHGASCHGSGGLAPAPPGTPVVALVGAPNAGKSTLFNALTGSRAVMGNWPGTTVEVCRGRWRAGATKDRTVDIIDFPGAYSLDPMSPDEEFTRAKLIEDPVDERPDAVVVVVDTANLARCLYLVAQIAEEPYRIVVALTKLDVAASRGISVDVDALSRATGVPVVAVDPRRNELSDLADTVARELERSSCCVTPVRPVATSDGTGTDGEDADFAREDARFAWVDEVCRDAVTSSPATDSVSDRIDRVALNPVAGPLVFLAAMWLVFQITTTVAAPMQDYLDGLFGGPVTDGALWIMNTVGLTWEPLRGLVTEGLIGGVGMVLTFVPLMALMFLCLAVLEDSGYMARAAVVADRLMRAIGLPGKAFIPLIVGFGCNVPAISATRVLGSARQRLVACLLVPFTSCSARLTVYVMVASVFFPEHSGTVVFVMYLISIGLVVLTGLGLRTMVWRTLGSEPLVIDLPVYQLPGPRLALSVMWMRLKGFLHTAGRIIVATVVVVWALQSTPVVGGYGFGDEDLPPQDSAYGAVSSTMAPVFGPAGFGTWSLTGPLITGFVAKEAVISSWAQTYAVEDPTDADPEEQAESPLAAAIRVDFAEASGGHALAAVWAFMIFLLAYTPCVATLAAQRREIGLWWTVVGTAVQLTGAWALAVLVFNALRLVL